MASLSQADELTQRVTTKWFTSSIYRSSVSDILVEMYDFVHRKILEHAANMALL